jgi:tetratricopeptide (TPR) repeat protein
LQRARAKGQAAEGKARTRPRRAWLALALALPVLGAGGYVAGRQLWAAHHRRHALQALDQGDPEAALADLNRCAEVWPDDPQIHLLLARAYRMAGNETEAFRHLEACRRAGGSAEDIALESLLAAAAAGKLEQSEGPLRQLLRAGHSRKRDIREALVRGYLLRERSADAEALATAWVDEEPGDWQAWLLRGFARSQTAEGINRPSAALDLARQDYERVLQLKPDQDMARFLLGVSWVRIGQFHEALPHLELYARHRPEDGKAVAELARCHRSLGQVEEARQVLDGWLAGHGRDADVFVARGQVAMDLGRPEEALDFFRRADAVAPGQEKTEFQLARALRTLGRGKEAADYEQRWRSHGELADHLKQLEEVAAREPQNVAVRHEAGVVALRQGDEAAALRWLAAALKLDPKYGPTHQALAAYFERKGNKEAAAFHRRLAGQGP